jgi:hypothetical protein
MSSEQVKAIVEASLAIAKRRYVGGDRTRLQPCWCEDSGDTCVNHPHCEKARKAMFSEGKANG